MARSLDETDWRVLAELQRDARQPFSELGRNVGLSQSAVAERVRGLEASGVIRAYRADVDLRQVGYPMMAFIRVTSDGEKCRKLQRAVIDMPEVLECHRITGEGSSLLRVGLRSIPHLETLIDTLLKYGSTSTSLVLSTTVELRNVQNASMLR